MKRKHMNKLKELLSNKKVQLVEFIVLAVDAAALILGGQSVESISGVIPLVGGAIAGIGAVIVAINALVKGDK
jgi:hypothetical protein